MSKEAHLLQKIWKKSSYILILKNVDLMEPEEKT